jgi:ABC-type Fe3+-hydroxamate transport system substrate-binding protein
MRIVSLLPSATESLCLVGGRGLLVGRSHECDYPAGLESIPVLTSQTTSATASASEIDAAVRAQLSSAQSLYRLDVDLLRQLKPDLILTQDLCEVCSIDLNTVRAAAADLSPRPEILSLNPRGLEDVFDDILRIGVATGLSAEAMATVVKLRERLFRAADFVNPFTDGPVVAFLEWTDPLFIGGHWTPQLIERAGGRHPLNPTVAAEDSGAAAGPQAGSRLAGKSIRIPVEALIATKPDALIICPCGISLPRVREMAANLGHQAWWPDLPAVRTGRVALVDGNQMFNRPGPRLIDAFEWLVGWLNDRPELIPKDFPWETWRGNAGPRM